MHTTSHRRRAGPYLVGAALAGTLALGVWMRWALAGALSLPIELDHMRHAHSHLGYYGVLFPLAWLGWRAAGAPVPGRRTVALYLLATLVATVGFLRAGYGPEAIAGSTVVGGIWLASSWRLRDRMRSRSDPLALALPGVLAAEACIGPIAYFVRRDPQLAADFVSTFLAALLLMVVVPSALAARRVEPGPWPALCASSALGAAALGVWPAWPALVGLSIYAGLLGWGALQTPRLPAHLRATWLAVALGLLALAVGLVPNVRPVAIGAIHFVILSPVLASFAVHWLRRPPPPIAWWIYHGAVALMSAALLARGLGAPHSKASVVAAIGGSAAALWWVAVAAASVWRRLRADAASPGHGR